MANTYLIGGAKLGMAPLFAFARAILGKPNRAQRQSEPNAARQTDTASSKATAAGKSHQTFVPSAVSSFVSPSARATPAATCQSSPTMKSHQKRPNARTCFTLHRPKGGARAVAAEAGV